MRSNLLQKWIEDPSIHYFAKDIVKQGMQKDPVDAYYDCQQALAILKARMDNALGFDWDKVQW